MFRVRLLTRSAFLTAAAVLLILVPAAHPSYALPTLGNVIEVTSGDYVPAYAVTSSGSTDAVGFQLNAGTLSAYDDSGTQLWQTSVDGTGPHGGFDFDDDGWPDVFLVESESIGSCSAGPYNRTRLVFYSGQTGTKYTPVAWLNDICWTQFGYATSQWTHHSVVWGAPTNEIVVTPYYATTSWIFGFNGSSFTTVAALYYPSTASYDVTYTASQPNPFGGATDYVQYSHIANGLLTEVNGTDRLTVFTSGRGLQYNLAPLTSTQLAADAPFLSTGSTVSLAGRNYGEVAVDPADPGSVLLVAGTANYSLYLDRLAGSMGSDEWGGIERHVTLYDPDANTMSDKFYSSAHEDNDGRKYDGRVSYVANPMVTLPSGPSRYGYNVYEDGQWHLHITEPGSLTDLYASEDVFLWDIADLDGDGVDEWLVSPTDTAGGYLPQWTTTLYHWDEGAEVLNAVQTIDDAVPYLQPHFDAPDASTTGVHRGLYPAQVIVEDGTPKLLMRTNTGQIVKEPV